jgi:hypothetical protein
VQPCCAANSRAVAPLRRHFATSLARRLRSRASIPAIYAARKLVETYSSEALRKGLTGDEVRPEEQSERVESRHQGYLREATTASRTDARSPSVARRMPARSAIRAARFECRVPPSSSWIQSTIARKRSGTPRRRSPASQIGRARGATPRSSDLSHSLRLRSVRARRRDTTSSCPRSCTPA